MRANAISSRGTRTKQSLTLLAVCTLSGCYLSHVLDRPDASAPRDAGHAMPTPARPDAGRDLGLDAGPPDLGMADLGPPDFGAPDFGTPSCTDASRPPGPQPGDINGDGFADILVGAPTADSTGAVSLFLGGPCPSATAAAILYGPLLTTGGFGETTAKLGDVNRDGCADVMVGTFTDESASLYLGGPAGLAARPSLTLPALDGAFGTSLAGAQDVNGDGFMDVIVGAAGNATAMTSFVGHAYVYLGNASGLSSTPATTLPGLDGENEYFGEEVASAGDLNGDGYGDVMVGAQAIIDDVHFGTGPFGMSSCIGTRRVFFYLGGPAGLSTVPTATITGLSGGIDGCAGPGQTAGDFNGDGFSDVALGEPTAPPIIGRAPIGAVEVYAGGAAGLSTTPLFTLTGAEVAGIGQWNTMAVEDLNADGYSDLILGGVNDDAAYIFLGSAAGLSPTPTTTLVAPGPGEYFGSSAAAVGDVNGDGFPDVVIGSSSRFGGPAGHAYLYLGSASGLETTPAMWWTDGDPTTGFGESSATADGDLRAVSSGAAPSAHS